MSTFNGIIPEFPQIRIDHFRHHPHLKAPLACFLSHVHSDHLVGLESLRAPFVYCSSATREILLRLEKYHYRANFAKGILESRNVTYDRSMRKLAKPLPLDTPTIIELSPQYKIRVTLLDANHCVGAVMFLIEGDGKAILYTGDIRAEPWWVNSLLRNPVLLPYTLGSRSLDCMYLDTTFASKSVPYRDFPSKAEGIRELLQQIDKYSPDTIFYFHSWTFGYEDVWIALSSFLHSQIHLDEYRYRLYSSISTANNKEFRDARLGFDVREAPALCGFKNGNHLQAGCLTSDYNVRLHSCEHGMGCPVIDDDKTKHIVHLIPIVTRVNGTEIAEVGAGGGKGDLDQKEELDTSDVDDIGKLMELCASKIEDPGLLTRVLALLQQALDAGNVKIDLQGEAQRESQESETGQSLQSLISILSSHVEKEDSTKETEQKTIRFPYSRHSSYSELCHLVEAFKPKDVFPCTVDEKNWTPAVGMQNLFGQFCSESLFRHDTEMMQSYERRMRNANTRANSQDETQDESQMSNNHEGHLISPRRNLISPAAVRSGSDLSADADIPRFEASERHSVIPQTSHPFPTPSPQVGPSTEPNKKPQSPSTLVPSVQNDPYNVFDVGPDTSSALLDLATITTQDPTTVSATPDRISGTKENRKKRKITDRAIAYKAALGIELTWEDYGGLLCTKKQEEEDEL